MVGFLNWTRGPGTSDKLAETLPAWYISTPRFLAAQRSAVSSRREEIAVVALAAQHNTRVCGPLCDPRGSSHAVPDHCRASSTVFASTLFLDCNCKLVCSSFNDQTAEQQIWQSFAAARHFCSAKILAGGLRWGWGPHRSREIAPPAQRNFQRKFALRQVGSSKFVVPPTRKRSKVRNNARLGKSLYRAAPGCQRDRGPSVSGGVQRNPFQGVPLGNFFAEARHRASLRS